MKSVLDRLIRLEFRPLPEPTQFGQTHRVILHCQKQTYGGLFTFEPRLTMKVEGSGRNVPVREGDVLWLNYREPSPGMRNVVWAQSAIKTG